MSTPSYHEPATSVSAALISRHSIREFEKRPVDDSTLRQVLQLAGRAPSWKNTQPWRVRVVTGATRQRLSERMIAEALSGNEGTPETEWPGNYPSEARKRMMDLGMSLYGVAGIDRKDKEGRKRFALRNFEFFDAPVAIFITSVFDLNYYIGIDIGCYLQSLMLVAREFGLGTCPQAALGAFPQIVREELALPAEEKVIVGLSLGYPLADSALNAFTSEREPLEEQVRFYS